MGVRRIRDLSILPLFGARSECSRFRDYQELGRGVYNLSDVSKLFPSTELRDFRLLKYSTGTRAAVIRGIRDSFELSCRV